MVSVRKCISAVAITLTTMFAVAEVSGGIPDAAISDPAKMEWMEGAPPPAERTLRFYDGSFFKFPAMRWSVSNFRQLMPTVNVSRGLGAPVPFSRSLRNDIDAIRFIPLGSAQPMTWEA